MPGDDAKRLLAGTRFADVRWVAETGSTNADLLALARGGAEAGVVLVADHQTAGRGRAGRSFVAPPRASLLVSVLLRPPPRAVSLTSIALGVAAVDAVSAVAGFAPQLKWPNDLVHDARKLAGILAEAHWPTTTEVAVVVGIGLNVNWPETIPDDLADIAIAINHVVGHDVDREELLVALLQNLDARCEQLGRRELLDAWRDRSATLGKTVKVDLGAEIVEGVARDITDEGHLLVDDRVIAVGDVVHLR